MVYLRTFSGMFMANVGVYVYIIYKYLSYMGPMG